MVAVEPLSVPRRDETARDAIARTEDHDGPLTVSMAAWIGARFDPAMLRTRLGQRVIAEATRATAGR